LAESSASSAKLFLKVSKISSYFASTSAFDTAKFAQALRYSCSKFSKAFHGIHLYSLVPQTLSHNVKRKLYLLSALRAWLAARMGA